MSKSVEDLLSGSGVKPAGWNEQGTRHGGEVTKVEVVQSRDIQTGEPSYWGDGQAKEQIRVTVQTDERDPEEPDDDGLRALYLKGGKASKSIGDGKTAKTSLEAVKDALKVVGARTIDVGGHLTLQFAVEGERTKPGFNPPKLFLAVYKAPAAASVDPNALI